MHLATGHKFDLRWCNTGMTWPEKQSVQCHIGPKGGSSKRPGDASSHGLLMHPRMPQLLSDWFPPVMHSSVHNALKTAVYSIGATEEE